MVKRKTNKECADNLDVRLYASPNNPKKHHTVSWIGRNKERSIEMIGQLISHELLPGDSTAEQARMAKKATVLYLRYLADKLELEESLADSNAIDKSHKQNEQIKPFELEVENDPGEIMFESDDFEGDDFEDDDID